jgi:hypothetical protein
MIVTILATSLLLTSHAHGDERCIEDATGDAQALGYDVVAACHAHVARTFQRPSFITHSVSGERSITDEPLEARFNFDTRGSRAFDMSVVVSRRSDGSWQAELYAAAFPIRPEDVEASQWRGFVGVSQPDDRSIEIRIRKRDLGRLSKPWGPGYRWFVEAYDPETYDGFCRAEPMPGGGHADMTCYDRAPAVRHILGSR